MQPVLSFSFQRAMLFWWQFSGKVGKICRVTHTANVPVDNHMKEKRDFLTHSRSAWCGPNAQSQPALLPISLRSQWILWSCVWICCQDALICPCGSQGTWVQRGQPQAWICSYCQLQNSPVYSTVGKMSRCLSVHMASTSQKLDKINLLWLTASFNFLHQRLKI